MITMKSSLRDVYRHPIGKDLIDLLLWNSGKSVKLIQNPLTGSLRLSQLDRVLGKAAPGLAETIVELLNSGDDILPPSPAAISHAWWKEAVVYQIYPRSFMDSNGDGIGDLAGIRSRIPYLKDLGVDVVWLCPIYDSPNDDNGYDIRNYRKILKEFGNLQSFNALLKDLHANGIKLIMDLVVNHTSDEHEWFKKAVADPDSPEHGYYLWQRGRGATEADPQGRAPNNWTSFFSGPAWNYYPEREEWAMHLFSAKQMDLNWENPALRQEVYDTVRFWMDKGVDGFRMDVINLISKGSLADGNEVIGSAFGVRGIEHYFYGPKLHRYLRELRQEGFSGYDAFTVGETPGMGLNMCRLLTAEERGELDMTFNFDHLENPGKSRKFEYRYDLRYLKPYFLKWQTQFGNNCWPSLFFENHDNPRMVSKVNPDPAYSVVIAKLLAALQLTLKGTPFIYQGQELGMTNSNFTSITEMRDVETLNRYAELKDAYAAAGPEAEAIAFDTVMFGSRDHARTPMQWDSTEHAGFTAGTPWLKVNPNYPVINAKLQGENPDSVFHFFKTLIALRHQHEALVYGDFSPVFTRDKNTFCYFRILEGEKFYIEINLTEDDQKRPGPLTAEHKLLAGNYGGTSVMLRPYEANVYQI
ncbi:alpha-glucosidase [Ruminococcaceae bacterium OttesenSCG-928-A11]|nr:alpha-glucosidase [Ruminococcaceae bacterium OttesenSCG-928-A11]